jgi:acetylornithine deacetylase
LPHSIENGGLLKVAVHHFVEGRGNIIIEYPALSADSSSSSPEVVSFVGSHLDVVPANPADWERDPFQLFIEGDKLYGRGTTDCLG